jgi:hypothetical protein
MIMFTAVLFSCLLSSGWGDGGVNVVLAGNSLVVHGRKQDSERTMMAWKMDEVSFSWGYDDFQDDSDSVEVLSCTFGIMGRRVEGGSMVHMGMSTCPVCMRVT